MYCSNCGNQISDDSKFCPECGAAQTLGGSTNTNGGYYYDTNNNYNNMNYNNNNGQGYQGYNGYNEYGNYNGPRKSRLVAGLLQIFLGYFGIGRFYLGYTGMGLAQLFTSFLCGVGYIWAFIDGILILCGKVDVDGKGVPLKD